MKQLKKVGVKLDILRHMAPHISRPEVALTFLNQLLVMLGSVKKTDSITKVRFRDFFPSNSNDNSYL